MIKVKRLIEVILIYEMAVGTMKVQGLASGTAEDKEKDVAMDISSEDKA
jgi:hypothetical protein